MNEIQVIGIDLAKLLDTIRQFPAGSMIAMEACPISHYWGRTFQSIGFHVRLIPTQHVKALTHHQKNGANDALAICETTLRPGIHFVTIKTVEQQDIKALRSARQLMVEQRTVLANQLGHWRQNKVLKSLSELILYSNDWSTYCSSVSE